MSEFFIPIKGSAPRRIPQKQFKLPIQESMKIIDEVRKVQKFNKTIRPDEHRKSYQTLLQWATTSLQSTKQLIDAQSTQQSHVSLEPSQPQTIAEQVQIQQRRIVQTLMLQLTEMFKRECKQKSQLMQICFQYFNQLINRYTKYYEKEFHDTLKNYNIELEQIEGEYDIKLAECNKRISFLQGEKQTKWKNIYMLAKDNRILRRQKGKLLRVIQEQDEKIKIIESQLCQVVKENQMNKLIIRFQNDSQNLQIFMKNRLSLMKFQKIIEKYPKNAMKVLHNDLIKLQIEQLNSLDSKIDYIKRVIIQSGQACEEYEDLHELITKPNRMVFNVFTQTDPEDITQPKEFREFATNYDLQQTFKAFDTWEQVYDIKVPGWPEMREKFIAYRNPNRVPNITKPFVAKKKSDPLQRKEFFLMQLCSKQIDKTINIKTKKKSNDYFVMLNTGVTYNPKLKNKSKLYFVMPYQNRTRQNEQYDENEPIVKQVVSVETKIQKQIQTRKSQVFFHKKYQQNKRNFTQMKSKNSQKSFQKEISQLSENSKQNSIIQEQSQFDSSLDSQTVDGVQEHSNLSEDKESNATNQQNQQNQESESTYLPKFNKKKRVSRRVHDLSFLELNRNSSTQKMSIFREETMNNPATTRYSVNVEKTYVSGNNKNQRLSTQESKSKRKHQNSQFILSKTSRIKTSQNERFSRSSNLNRTQMEQIYEDPDENQGSKKNLKWQSQDKINRLSYVSSPKSLIKSKFAETMATMNNTGNVSKISSKQNRMNQIEGIMRERNTKHQMSWVPRDSNISAKKISKLALRNASFNQMKLRQRQSVNVETISRNSISSQNNQQFDFKSYLTDMKPKESFEILQSQVLNPVLIRPLEAKKLAQKIIRKMYSRRKQILSSQACTSLRTFVEDFLKQIYGNNWKGEKNLLRYEFTVEDRESSMSIKAFTIMLNSNVQVEYLQDLFRLYVTMLEKNEFSNPDNPVLTSKTKGAAILRYLLSVYFDESTANDIQQNLPFMSQFEVDLNEVFIVVETHLRKFTIETEIYSFLQKLLPENQSYIEFSQIKEILYLFKNEQNYHTHMARLKYFFKTYGKVIAQQQQSFTKLVQTSKTLRTSTTVDKPFFSNRSPMKQTIKEEPKVDIEILPIHRVCLYLKRYQWTDLIDINSFVQQKFYKIVGVFIQDESIKFITKYCASLDEAAKKRQANLIGGMNISVLQATTTAYHPVTHPLTWLLNRTKELIRNYYRYKGPLDRHFLMFVHISILMYELDLGVNDVVCESLQLLSLECKKLKTKEEVHGFMKG